MAYRAGFTLNERELDAKLDKFEDQAYQFVTLATNFAAKETLAQMKVKAPWTDRTGAARSSLNVQTRHNKARKSHRINFAHGVDYGIWLEVANSGKYAIIIPTVAAVGKEIMAALNGMLNHLDQKPRPRAPRIDVPKAVPAKAKKGAAAAAQAKYAASKANKSKATKKTATTSRTKRS
ncbi:hypothetical protein SEA_AIKOY__29 [Mycobacterium phage Aikoy]|uniref:Minor tail protein n=1 Tax=Mycobacterium phage Onyinye TaxID=2686235 RepID=A0A6B9L739_9CAUD|nr:hypothetical protein PP339_gp030 [Mycobacterium phage Onyinye]QHB37436.1 hypothetical protein SEA_ONYINYE_30 [Mycobacterium phage Onyinye]WKW85191.1 hypothetical protein SEA_AIKOY__29 [Mycobacterium phage Aikoy]